MKCPRRAQTLGLVFLVAGAVGLAPARSLAQSPANGCYPLPAGAIAWWPGNGNYEDVVGQNNGVLSSSGANSPSGTSFTAGLVGPCFHFTNSSIVNFTTSLPQGFGTNDFTVEFWARFDGTNTLLPEAFLGDGQWSLQWDGASLGFSTAPNSSLVAPVLFNPVFGQWIHLAWERSGDTYTIYTNAVAAGSQTTTNTVVFAPSTVFAIGGPYNSSPIRQFFGDMDEVTTYSRALGQSELAGIVAAGSAGKCFPAFPSVAIEPLTNQTPLSSGANVLLSVNPAPSSPTNPIAEVLFYSGTTLLATVTNSPWEFVWTDVSEGSYVVTVHAVDAEGAISAPETINIVVRPGWEGPVSSPSPYTLSTLAGRAPRFGFSDGPGSAALFNAPRQIATDSAGNFYVADAQNNAVRKVAPDGTTTTLAGGSAGFLDGLGTNAGFSSPSGIGVDAAGNVYVADRFNFTIRKISMSGTVTTLAGSPGHSGATNGTGASAFFNHPCGLAVDLGGNVYVADTFNDCIRVVTPAGAVSTLAGQFGQTGAADGPGTNALFASPIGIAVDSQTNVYVADTGNCAIRKITPGGAVSTVAGLWTARGSADGSGTNAQFAFPKGIAVDGAGNLFVADTGNNTIRKIAADGTVTTVGGQAGAAGATDSIGTNALFYAPWGIAVDATGNLLVAESGNHSIRKISPGGQVSTLAGPGGSSGSDNGPARLARFNYPSGVAVDGAGNVVVADLLNFLVRQIGADGVVRALAGQAAVSGDVDGSGGDALFAGPAGVAVDLIGNIYVADADNQTVRLVDANGNVATFAGQPGQAGTSNGPTGLALFNNPSGVAVDLAGDVYVADTGNHTIREIGADGQVSTLAGFAGVPGHQDGYGTNALFSSPGAVAVDAIGNIYVADTGNQTIREIAPDGTVTTVAGNFAAAGSADGVGTNATFSSMGGLAVDKLGNIYVADTYNDTIRMIATNGTVTTIGGFPGSRGSVDGTGENALFNNPASIAVDGAGNVYVADALNNTIRVGIPPSVVAPELEITELPGEIALSWPGWASGFVLQTAEALGPGYTWITVTNGISLVGGQYILTAPATGPVAFYRLRSE
jgi:sugar lactone lactonase YvrE